MTFDEALARWPVLRDLEGCPQDPLWHREGDALIHTRMVVEALEALPAWQALAPADRDTLWIAAALHDVGKPATTRTEPDGRITSKGHSLKGSQIARRVLYEEAMPFARREVIAGLVRWHQVPFHAVTDPKGNFTTRLAAEVCPLPWLGILAEADARGRVSDNHQATLDEVALFGMVAEDAGVANGPYPFETPWARLAYFKNPMRPADLYTRVPEGSRVIVMCGFPGSGKTRLLKADVPDLPVVSLDDLRDEMDVDPTDNQGSVVQAAKERAREFLRAKKDFAWDATNLNRLHRDQVVQLLLDYDAWVRIIYVEVPLTTLRVQNKDRARSVPWSVIEGMMVKWEVPTRTEAHEVVYAVR
jgi:putative nucleotidyltransferase with HDIG domain